MSRDKHVMSIVQVRTKFDEDKKGFCLI